MNKTQALEVFTAVVNAGENATVSATHDTTSESDNITYTVTLSPAGGAQRTLDDMHEIGRTLRDHDAVLQIPGMTIAMQADLDAAEAESAELERQQAELRREQEERVAAAIGGSSKGEGGSSIDNNVPIPEPSVQPFAGEDDIRDQRNIPDTE